MSRTNTIIVKNPNLSEPFLSDFIFSDKKGSLNKMPNTIYTFLQIIFL